MSEQILEKIKNNTRTNELLYALKNKNEIVYCPYCRTKIELNKRES